MFIVSDRVSGNETMGRNEYARHQGVTPNAVLKAVRSGRISKSVIYGDGGQIKAIKWRLADRLWAANTDPVEAAKSRKHAGPAHGTSGPERVQTSGRQRLPAPAVAISKQRELAELLGKIFGNSVIAFAAEICARHKLSPEVALDIVEGGLLTLNVAAADILGIADPGECKLMIHGDLEAALSPDLRPGLFDCIRATSENLAGNGNDDGPANN